MVARTLRRHRRLLRTSIAVVTAVAAIGGWLVWRGRGERYVPGEKTEGLVDTLARSLPDDRPRVTFPDVAHAAGLDVQHFGSARTNQLPEDMGSGVACGDFDGDGGCDLFFPNASGNLDDRANGFRDSKCEAKLFRNRGDGTFEDVTAKSGISMKALGHAALWVDVDGDGDLDLFVTTYDQCRLWRNDGGHFTDVSESSRVGGADGPRGFWTGVAAGDVDRDGDVDLYVCGYVKYDPKVSASAGATGESQYAQTIPVRLNPSSFKPERNLLFRNRGDGTFDEVAKELAVEDWSGRSLGVVCADFNGDQWPDLYVANDVSHNALYLNRGNGTFVECGAEALVGEYRGSMGLAAADFDDDLDLDLFISHWVAEEDALYVNVTNELEPQSVVKSDPVPCTKRLLFMDEADDHGLGQVALSVVGWATGFFDLDNDGRRDLFEVTGHTIPRKDDPLHLDPERSHLFWNGGDKRGFFEIGQVAGDFFASTHVCRGGALLDYDQDGDQDLVVVQHGGPVALLRNDGGNAQPCVRLRLRQKSGNTLALGARAIAKIGARKVLELVETQGSYLSQHAAGELSFGLGGARQVDELEVDWPDGTAEHAGPFPADSIVSWTRGETPVVTPLPGKPHGDATASSTRSSATAPSDAKPKFANAAAQKEFFELVDRAGALRLAGDFAGAAALYRRGLEIQPEHEDCLYYLGNCLVELGQEKEALEKFEALTRVDPRSNRAFMQIGKLRLPGGDPALDDLAKAEAAFQTSLSINQEESGPVVELGRVALLRGELDAADRRFADAARLNVKSIEARYLRAYIAFRRGERESARHWLDEARSIASGAAAAAQPKVVGEGDTKKGGALLADAKPRPSSLFERWRTLAEREIDVEREFAGAELR
jgi:tetratricopeptide (TPR) repeat protein